MKIDAGLEKTLISVWRQAMLEDAARVKVCGEVYAVRRVSHRRLRAVDFVFRDRRIRGLEQNPDRKSRWAALARRGEKVMQFIGDEGYLGNIADGKLTLYGRSVRS